MKGLRWIAVGMMACGLAAQAQSADEVAGAALFRKTGCEHCHGVNGAGTKKAPGLNNIRSEKLWTAAKITDQILNGGEKMPPFSDSLTDPEIAQLVAYLRAKKRPPLPGPVPENAAPAEPK
ncbi:MAG: cytochrome c [Terracidiphilus sp.]|nr:cytochrome c [Terracidiphilus sp.]